MTALAAGEVPQAWTGMRTSTERLGASGNLYFDDLGDLRAGAVYDVYSSLFSSYYATLDLFPFAGHGIEPEMAARVVERLRSGVPG